jgi:hypothetical protein
MLEDYVRIASGMVVAQLSRLQNSLIGVEVDTQQEIVKKPVSTAEGDDPKRLFAGLYALCLEASTSCVEKAGQLPTQENGFPTKEQADIYKMARLACEAAFIVAPQGATDGGLSPEQQCLNKIWELLSAMMDYAKGVYPSPWTPGSQLPRPTSGAQLPPWHSKLKR